MIIRPAVVPRTPVDARQLSAKAWLSILTARRYNDEKTNDKSGGKTKAIIAVSVVIVVIGILIGVVAFLQWKKKRAAQARGRYALSGREDADSRPAVATATTTTVSTTQTGRATTQTNAANVDRNTSVRSVMTLPAYHPKPGENEHVLAREGERDGIDMVIEMPTAEDDENLREDEMDALFQIREARRRQIAAREERRIARRTARERGDQLALQELRQQARQATTRNQEEIDNLRASLERTKETRQRAVSSVSYADLGVARHDGTRLRANSTESERVGLLSDAASIAASQRSPSSLNQNFPHTGDAHRRGRSGSSVLSIDTTHSDSLHQVPTHGTSRSRASSTGTHTQVGSSPELIDAADADLGDADMPLNSPPGYEEVSLNELTPAQSRSTSPYPEPPPDYTPGPTEARNRRVSAHIADLAAEATVTDSSQSGSAAPGTSGSDSSDSPRGGRSARNSSIPQLPSLHLASVPQIVIEPSSAAPRDNEPEHR